MLIFQVQFTYSKIHFRVTLISSVITLEVLTTLALFVLPVSWRLDHRSDTRRETGIAMENGLSDNVFPT